MIHGTHCALEQATKASIDLCFSVPCTEQSYMDPKYYYYSLSEQLQQPVFSVFLETERKIENKTHLVRLLSTSRNHFYQ